MTSGISIKSNPLVYFLALFLSLSFFSFAQPDGESLFKANCAACHKIDKKLVGPALRGVTKKYKKGWLIKWISDNQQLRKSGDALAKKVFEEGGKVEMTAFPNLSKQDIEAILVYTDTAPKEQPKKAVIVPPTQMVIEATDMNVPTHIAYIILFVVATIFIIVIYVLYDLFKNVLPKLVNEDDSPTFKQTLVRFAVKYANFILASVALIGIIILYFAYSYMMGIGVDKGYKPIQPIHFSHKIHAGDNQINCQYCHASARKSKTSGIPPLNVCMNCHKNISEYNGETSEEYSKAFYNAEIQKLYKAVGWDQENRKYTGKPEAVKWIRIHNLPDFVYFNHSQHVTVAGLDCKECHGPVDKMEIMEQFSDLTMGWCVGCHRTKKVDVKNNGYYQRVHKSLLESRKHGDSLTVAEMGGLECAKCHY